MDAKRFCERCGTLLDRHSEEGSMVLKCSNCKHTEHDPPASAKRYRIIRLEPPLTETGDAPPIPLDALPYSFIDDPCLAMIKHIECPNCESTKVVVWRKNVDREAAYGCKSCRTVW